MVIQYEEMSIEEVNSPLPQNMSTDMDYNTNQSQARVSVMSQ
jgi:hypothetical protein